MTAKEQLQKIKRLIAKAKLKEAVDLLLSYAESELSAQVDEMIAISSKYYEVEEMARNTTIAMPDYQRIRSQLIVQLLEKVATFEAELAVEIRNVPLIDIQETYKLSIARTKILRVLIEATDGVSIKILQMESGLKNRKYLIVSLNELIAAEVVERYKIDGISLNRLTEEGRKKTKKWF